MSNPEPKPITMPVTQSDGPGTKQAEDKPKDYGDHQRSKVQNPNGVRP